MDFFKLIQSLDELLYEVVSWILFYPLTLWRVIRSPIEMMKSADRELREVERKQFDDTIAPPLFLLLSLMLVHLAELIAIGDSRLAMRHPEITGLVGSDVNLTLFRILLFSILPLIAALRLVRARGSRLDRQDLKAPFYAQCYAAALFTLMIASAFLAAGPNYPLTNPRFLSITAFALIWLFVVEAKWFSAELHTSIGRGTGQATILIGQWLVLLVGTLLLIR